MTDPASVETAVAEAVAEAMGKAQAELDRELQEQLEVLGVAAPDNKCSPRKSAARALRFATKDDITVETWITDKRTGRKRRTRRQLAKVLLANAFNGLYPVFLFAYLDLPRERGGKPKDVAYCLRRYKRRAGAYHLASGINIRPNILGTALKQIAAWEGVDLLQAADETLAADIGETG